MTQLTPDVLHKATVEAVRLFLHEKWTIFAPQMHHLFQAAAEQAFKDIARQASIGSEAAVEREACATLVESVERQILEDIARRIRARGKP